MPRYRFHGAHPPVAGARTPVVDVRAESEVPGVVDGVATMRIYDPIDSWGGDWGVSAKEFVRALDALPDETEQIDLHLNSPGGEVFEAVTILNALRNHDAKVVAHIDGLAASAASFLAAGADEAYMGRNTQLMIHDAWGLCVGAAVDMRDAGDRLDKLSDNLAEVYAERSGTDVPTVRAAMLAETWYTPDEALAANLVDGIQGAKTDDAKAFDTKTLFNHASRSDAPAPLIPAPQPADDSALLVAHARQVRHAHRARALKRTA